MLAESAIRSLIRLVVTVLVLGAAYLFIVRPILDTTENTFNRAFETGGSFQTEINRSLRSAGIGGVDLGDPGSVKATVGDVDLGTAIANAPNRRTKRLLRCIDRADDDVAAISRCTARR
jgi:hypothetical protein